MRKLISISFLLFSAVLLVIAVSSPAAALERGRQRLRELAVFPNMDLNCKMDWNFDGSLWRISDGRGLPEEITLAHAVVEQKPDDTKSLLQMGFLLALNDQTNDSTVYYKRAEQICRRRMATQPQDGPLLVGLGKALEKLDKDEEAESIYRKAVLVSSNEWRCWAGLGYFLEQRSFDVLIPEHLRNQISFPDLPPQEVLDYRPSPGALKDAEALRREAARCFDRSMVLATNEWEAFIQHAGYIMSSGICGCFLRHFRDGEQMDAAKLRSAYFSKAAAADLRQAVALKPKDYRLIGLAAFLEQITGTVDVNPAHPDLGTAPDSSQPFLRECMVRLENLSQESDKKTAAGALGTLAMINLMQMNVSKNVVELARRAVALDPTREQSWEIWFGLSTETASPDELEAICQARLKQKDSARNHLILGKLFVKQSKWEKANEQTQAAMKLEPDNIGALMMQAALLIRQSDSDEAFEAGNTVLKRIEELLAKMPESDEKKERRHEYSLNAAIMYELSNIEEFQKKAKEMMAAYTRSHPDDEEAMKIYEAME